MFLLFFQASMPAANRWAERDDSPAPLLYLPAPTLPPLQQSEYEQIIRKFLLHDRASHSREIRIHTTAPIVTLGMRA